LRETKGKGVSGFLEPRKKKNKRLRRWIKAGLKIWVKKLKRKPLFKLERVWVNHSKESPRGGETPNKKPLKTQEEENRYKRGGRYRRTLIAKGGLREKPKATGRGGTCLRAGSKRTSFEIHPNK